MSLRNEHAGHNIVADEGSSGFFIAYCVTCRTCIGDYNDEGNIVYDDEHVEPEPKPREYIINPDGSFGGVREIQ